MALIMIILTLIAIQTTQQDLIATQTIPTLLIHLNLLHHHHNPLMMMIQGEREEAVVGAVGVKEIKEIKTKGVNAVVEAAKKERAAIDTVIDHQRAANRKDINCIPPKS